MANIPQSLLNQLYTRNSLENTAQGVLFSLKNRLIDAKLTSITHLAIGSEKIDLDRVHLETSEDSLHPANDIQTGQPIQFPLKKIVHIHIKDFQLPEGKHTLEIEFEASPFGKLALNIEDSIQNDRDKSLKIPRNEENDYSPEIVAERQQYIEQYTQTKLNHLKKFSFEPSLAKGNCEHFTGVAQVPIGFAGPIIIHGEHAEGEFLVPLATTEGTLVASYNRGIQLINQSGGATCTILDDLMQRAPVFEFESARGARDFKIWLENHQAEIAAQAESTSSIAKLQSIDIYLSNNFVFPRFNFTTGDAAGQNMVSKATYAACYWVFEHYKEHPIKHFYLEANMATDKKASHINLMRTRGKRIVAECTVKREVLIEKMRVLPEQLFHHAQIANIASIFAGANNNGLHAANALTALFIATGQDVANVAESSVGLLYSQLTEEKDLYVSITLPSLIVGTYGGGTGLATQKECLEVMGCYGAGKVQKFAEIVAGVVLAGEISLAAAISSSDWVASHEALGRNR